MVGEDSTEGLSWWRAGVTESSTSAGSITAFFFFFLTSPLFSSVSSNLFGEGTSHLSCRALPVWK